MERSQPPHPATSSLLEGYTARGDYVHPIHLKGPDGMTATILTLGCRIVDLRMPDGRPLVPSFLSLAEVEADTSYIGVAVGRVANRIRDGRITAGPPPAAPNLQLNENAITHIHGGFHAWDKRVFTPVARGPHWVHLHYLSPHGDQGYPAEVDVTVRYELRGNGALHLELVTRNLSDTDTVTNMTLHPYFDLTGNGGRTPAAALDWIVHAPHCSNYIVLDKINVPTGEICPVANTPHLDFRSPRSLGDKLPPNVGYDNFLIRDHYTGPQNAHMAHLVTVCAQTSGIQMQVESNQPGFQMYSAEHFDGKGTPGCAKGGSLAIEPSGFIDAANHPSFPSITLKPGQSRFQAMTFKFTHLS